MRIAVVGPSASGKSTLARALALRFAAPHIQLDALLWGPGWTKASPTTFDTRVDDVTRGDRWIVDGNHPLALERADAVVWLDFPLRVVLPRLALRTARRLLLREELWNGNRESLRKHLAILRRDDGRLRLNDDNLVVWTITSHRARRARWSTLLPKLAARVFRVRHPDHVPRVLAELA